jgi:hypothetical protein
MGVFNNKQELDEYLAQSKILEAKILEEKQKEQEEQENQRLEKQNLKGFFTKEDCTKANQKFASKLQSIVNQYKNELEEDEELQEFLQIAENIITKNETYHYDFIEEYEEKTIEKFLWFKQRKIDEAFKKLTTKQKIEQILQTTIDDDIYKQLTEQHLTILLHSKDKKYLVHLLLQSNDIEKELYRQTFYKTLSKQKFDNRKNHSEFWQYFVNKHSKKLSEAVIFASQKIQNAVSTNAKHTHTTNKQNAEEYAKTIYLVNPENPNNKISLFDILQKKLKSEKAEMFAKLKGFNVLIDKHNYKSALITITCPSKFHSTTQITNNLRIENKNFEKNLQTIENAIQHIENIKRELTFFANNNKLEIAGLNATQPHKSGTPHLHSYVFGTEIAVNKYIQKAKELAFFVNGDEKGADKHRFTVVFEEREKGQLTSYLANYLNLNETNIDNNAKYDEIAIFCNHYNIKRYSFFGLPSLTVWRTARKDKTTNTNKVIQSAKNGNFADFVEELGGIGFKKTKTRKEKYQINYIQKTNKYNELIKSLHSITFFEKQNIIDVLVKSGFKKIKKNKLEKILLSINIQVSEKNSFETLDTDNLLQNSPFFDKTFNLHIQN